MTPIIATIHEALWLMRNDLRRASASKVNRGPGKNIKSIAQYLHSYPKFLSARYRDDLHHNGLPLIQETHSGNNENQGGACGRNDLVGRVQGRGGQAGPGRRPSGQGSRGAARRIMQIDLYLDPRAWRQFPDEQERAAYRRPQT